MKQHYTFTFIGLLSLFAVLSSCNLINPAEPVPSYVHIEAITLTTDYDTEGSNSSKITDAWVYIDGNLQGCYELPVTFPIIAEGTHQIMVKAGIRVNGISATRAPYPFYKEYTKDINLIRGEVVALSPAVTYVPGLNFVWIEDFEANGMTIIPSAGGHDTSMYQYKNTLPDPNVFERVGSGIAKVDNVYLLNESMVNRQDPLPRGDAPVFLEFNYKCNYSFTVGLFEHGPAGTYKTPVLNFNPSSSWNKMYLYLSPTIAASGTAQEYTVFFGMLNNAGADSLGFEIDNMKLIRY